VLTSPFVLFITGPLSRSSCGTCIGCKTVTDHDCGECKMCLDKPQIWGARAKMQVWWASPVPLYTKYYDLFTRQTFISNVQLNFTQVSVADLGGANELSWQLVMYFCTHNCTSPSNDYAAVACSNNNQAQFQGGSVELNPLEPVVCTHLVPLRFPVPHVYISSLLISRCLTRPTVALRYSVLTSSYFKQLTS